MSTFSFTIGGAAPGAEHNPAGDPGRIVAADAGKELVEQMPCHAGRQLFAGFGLGTIHKALEAMAFELLEQGADRLEDSRFRRGGVAELFTKAADAERDEIRKQEPEMSIVVGRQALPMPLLLVEFEQEREQRRHRAGPDEGQGRSRPPCGEATVSKET